MRKLVSIILVIFLFTLNAQAQNRNINKADKAREDGEYQEAITLIEEAVVHEKTADDPEAWFIRGQIYEEIALSPDPGVQTIDENAVQKSVESYNKVLEMTDEKNKFNGLATLRIDNIWSKFLNKGATKYQEGDYEIAIKNFEIAKEIKPNDTTAYLYTGAAAQSAEKYDYALENYYKFIELGNHKVDVYGSIIAIEKFEQKDTAQALKMVRQALEHHPDNEGLKREEINLLILTNQLSDALKKLNKEIENDPDNPQLYYSQGYMYDEIDSTEAAINSYEKAIELKDDFFEANYNLAVLFYNKGAEKFKEANNLSIKEYQKRGSDIEDLGKEWFRKSLPYWKKAHELKPEDIATLENLQGVYIRLQMPEKAEEMRKKVEELRGPGGK